jgi:hypothetical protein
LDEAPPLGWVSIAPRRDAGAQEWNAEKRRWEEIVDEEALAVIREKMMGERDMEAGIKHNI